MEQLFGTGLVETLEDMGTQGALPTHRELLDWLSYQFMYKYNWSVKDLVKTLVMSATYQQDSKLSPETEQKTRTTNTIHMHRGFGYHQNRYATRHYASAV